ncbi:MAG: YcxB family protein [Caldicoprobacterales bacterium]
MEDPKFIINTIMTKEDYRKFLYIATFRRNKLIIPFIVLISLVGATIISLDNGSLNVIGLIISWIFLFALAIGLVLFKVERKNAQRVKTDKTGAFDSINTLKFYDDRMVMGNEVLKSTGELKYSQFHALMKSKDYFIFYITANQASLIRKQDIEDITAFEEFILEKFENRYKSI